MPEYLAPGVYVEETSFRSKSIEGVSTSTTGFVGPTRRGPVAGPPQRGRPEQGTPELITSFGDFERIYGGLEPLDFLPDRPNYLANAVRAYFNEGGARLYVARVFTPGGGGGDGRAAIDLVSPPGGNPNDRRNVIRFAARNPGSSGRGRLTLTPRSSAAARPTMDRAPLGSLVRLGTAAPARPAVLAGGVPPFALDDNAQLRLTVSGTALSIRFRGRSAEATAQAALADPVVLDDTNRTLALTIDGVTQRVTLPAGNYPRADLVIGLNAAMRGGYARLSGAPTPNQLIIGSDRRGTSSSVGVALNNAFGFTADVPVTPAAAGAENNVADLMRVSATEIDALLRAAVQAAGAGTPGLGALVDATTGRLNLVTTATGAAATLAVVDAGAGSAHTVLGLAPPPPGGNPATGRDGAAQTYYVKTETGWSNPANPSTTLDLTSATALSNGAESLSLDLDAEDRDGYRTEFVDLGLDRRHPRWLGAVLAESPSRRIDALENVFAIEVGPDVHAATLWAVLFPNDAARTLDLSGGDDGGEPTATAYEVALARLERIDDISIVAAPGHSASSGFRAIQAALLTHVESKARYRIAVLDSRPDQVNSEVRADRGEIDSTRAALYYPWVVVRNPLARPGADNLPKEIALPPSGFVCGIYARTDNQTGVWKAPANEAVLSALRFETDVNFAEQGELNPLGVNCLRSFAGRGYRVWGARTASSDPEWKYVNIRRYFNYLERSIDVGTQWAVFMPNGERLWANVTETVSSFLYNEWVSGALLGATTKEAYFVRCDRSTMTQNDLDNGRLVCLIGVAAIKPAEFVIFRIGQKTADNRN